MEKIRVLIVDDEPIARYKPAYPERLVIKSGGRIFFLDVAELDWIESADNYVRLHTGCQSHLLRDGKELTSSRRYRKKLNALLGE